MSWSSLLSESVHNNRWQDCLCFANEDEVDTDMVNKGGHSLISLVTLSERGSKIESLYMERRCLTLRSWHLKSGSSQTVVKHQSNNGVHGYDINNHCVFHTGVGFRFARFNYNAMLELSSSRWAQDWLSRFFCIWIREIDTNLLAVGHQELFFGLCHRIKLLFQA